MSEGAGLQFSFQGEGLVIPPKPEVCEGCSSTTGDEDIRPYLLKLQERPGRPPEKIVTWYCKTCEITVPDMVDHFHSLREIEVPNA